jgi:hypothetical protein
MYFYTEYFVRQIGQFGTHPADAIGVKQELEKMLAQDGKPPRERQGDSVNETAESETPHL